MLRASCLAAVLLFAVPAVAPAQAPEGSTFAGGFAAPGTRIGGNSEIGVTVLPGGASVRVRGVANVNCARNRGSEQNGEATLPLAPDGSFSGTLRDMGRQPDDRRYTGTLSVTGRVTPEKVTGTASVNTRLRGGRSFCKGDVPFDARPAPAVGPDPAPVAPGVVLLGRTSGVSGGPFGASLSVSRTGRRVDRLVVTYRARCRRIRGGEETNYSPPMTIRSDGSFRKTERFSIRYSDGTDRVTILNAGRFVTGGATGTFRARSTFRSKRTGRITDRCDSGTLTWSAVV